MHKSLLELAAEIVQAQASTGTLTPEQIETFLVRTFNTFQRMQHAEEEARPLTEKRASEIRHRDGLLEKRDPQSSILEDKIICLECGAEFRQLTANHLGTHQLTPRDYKKKWGFPLKQPLAAKALTKARSKAAKKRGLPIELQQFQEERRRRKAKATAPRDLTA